MTIKNRSQRIAFFCQLLLTDTQGKPIHGTFYSDNFFSMLPGEKQVITIRTPKCDKADYRLRFNENMGAKQNITLK